MRLGKSRPCGQYEPLVAAVLDIYGFDYRCQVHFRNTTLDETGVNSFWADFVLVGLDLVIEVDDPGHDKWQERARDRIKDRVYREKGFTVMRIPTCDIDRNLDEVSGRIVEAADRQARRRGW